VPKSRAILLVALACAAACSSDDGASSPDAAASGGAAGAPAAGSGGTAGDSGSSGSASGGAAGSSGGAAGSSGGAAGSSGSTADASTDGGGDASAGAAGSAGQDAGSGGGGPFDPCVTLHGCGAGLYCDFPDDQCGSGSVGTCALQPTGSCLTIIDPVCGCDGTTYMSGICSAAQAGYDIKYSGPCLADGNLS
jgi:hypothetical protein